MNDYIEIVENPGQEQPWHNRIVGGNHEPEWTTETFHREDTARESILRLGRMFSPVQKATVTEHELIVWIDEDELGAKLIVPIRPTRVDVSDGEVHDLSPRRSALLEAAADVDKMHRIGTTRRRDASPEDLAWWEDDARKPLRQIAKSALYEPVLPQIVDWLRALAGGRQP